MRYHVPHPYTATGEVSAAVSELKEKEEETALF
jgi:hypothetical protein